MYLSGHHCTRRLQYLSKNKNNNNNKKKKRTTLNPFYKPKQREDAKAAPTLGTARRAAGPAEELPEDGGRTRPAPVPILLPVLAPSPIPVPIPVPGALRRHRHPGTAAGTAQSRAAMGFGTGVLASNRGEKKPNIYHHCTHYSIKLLFAFFSLGMGSHGISNKEDSKRQ